MIMENIVFNCVSKFLNTRYNFSLILFSFIIWYFSLYFSYSSYANFDMLVTVNGYIKHFSLLSIIVGFVSNSSKSSSLVKISIICYVISFLAVMGFKILFVKSVLGILILFPLSIFSFTLVLKSAWNMALEKDNKI